MVGQARRRCQTAARAGGHGLRLYANGRIAWESWLLAIRKAIIPAAGLGTRLFPFTASIPKELLPVFDQPLIQYALDEAASLGIEEAIVVTSAQKPALEEFLTSTREQSSIPRLTLVSQPAPKGLGHAVLTAADAVGDEPFLVLLPDDLVFGETSASRQILDVYDTFNASVVAVEQVPLDATSRYGIIEGNEMDQGIYRITGLVEKPEPEQAPSNLGIVGRYVLSPRVFPCLERTAPGANGEIQLTDGLALLLDQEPVYARCLTGVRHDGGTPLGLLKASLDVALRHPEAREAMLEFIATLLSRHRD